MPPFLRAQALRFRARLAALRGSTQEVERGFKAAAGAFRELSTPFWLAVTLLEHAEWLSDQGRPRDAEPLFDDAQETFERLKATPWLDRVARTRPTPVAMPAS